MDCRFPGYYKQQGFTLLELLLAISIFAVVVSMVYGAYNITFKVINNASSHAKYEAKARVTFERLTEDLESFHLGSSGFLEGETNNLGGFRADSLKFTSTAHLVFNKDELPVGYAIISYNIEEMEVNGPIGLYRGDIGFKPGGESEENKGFLLCDGLREVAFTYVDVDGNETETWEGNPQNSDDPVSIPVMVRLRIDFASEEVDDGTVSFSTGVALPNVK